MKTSKIEQFELFTPVTNVIADELNQARRESNKAVEALEWSVAKLDKAAAKAANKLKRAERKAARKAAKAELAASIADSVRAKWAAWVPACFGGTTASLVLLN
jgi:uncharacterized protein YoxC